MGIQKSLMDLRDAVYELYQSGRAVQLEITLTPNCDEQTKRVFERPGCVNIQEIIPYEEIPSSLASADLLVLAYDFDSEAVKINRYSMPTRTTEFMVSGTPVLVYGPSELAVTEYARSEKWAEIVAEPEKKRLIQALIRLMDDQALRKKLGCRAKELAIQNHDAVHVREAFRQALVYATRPKTG
jgi:glycosyltransferase involved in cell wall biosynthesis